VTEISSIDSAVTTLLVHRVHRGDAPWWSHAVVCDVAGSVDDAEMAEVSGLLLDISRAGFSAILIRPARSDIALDGSALAGFTTRAHRAGLKVLVRLSGARVPGDPEDAGGAFTDLEDGVSTLVVRARAALKAGADGIDLGIIDEGGPARDEADAGRFTHLVRILHAELADFDPMPILTAEALLGDEPAFRRHLEEDWFHHLRDDALVTAPWEAGALRRRVRSSLSERDRLGQVAAWHWSHTRVVHDSVHVPEGSWEYGSSEARRTAMALYSLTLPGAAYVPFCHLGGRTHALPCASSAPGAREADRYHRTWGASPQAAGEARLLARATRVRAERLMGTGSLAFVDGLPWAPPEVAVHICAGVMVVLNTSDAPVLVPAEHRLLLCSDASAAAAADEPTRIGPDACAWFDTARVQPAPVEVHD
jgi:alpha-glucosidase